jgi:hypothetical protein
VRRYYQKPVAPVEFPPALRARLDACAGSNLADRFRREAVFDSYRPKIAQALALDHLAIAGAQCRWYHKPDALTATGTRVANSFDDARNHTLLQHGELSRAQLGRAFDEQEIRDYAENYARMCAGMLTLEHRADFARSLGVEPPTGRNVTRVGACARLDDPQWWRRQLRRTWTRRAENVMREIGIVRKGREPYASDDAVQARAQMKAKGREFLKNHVAANENGEQLSLFKLAEHSLANPALRRGEFMTRVRGFEEIAADAGHVAQFWTLTCPSAFHAQLSTGQKNPNFARGIVRDAQAWLCKQWARVRAKLKRLSILIYGFRIAEPHHDATPHWHLLLFCRPRDASTIEQVVRRYWLSEYGDEKGAREHRAKCIEIDSTQGSAAGYVAKYVSKNIDGAGAIGDATDEETGRAVGDGVRRVDAWASLHGIRQFQQVGGPPVGLWRELRRITEAVDDEDIERARARADVGDWRGFIYSISGDGIRAGRRTSLRIAREETGELTKYAEEKAAPVIGVRWSSVVEITRPHTWRIQRCGTVAHIGGGNSSQPADTSACVAPDAAAWNGARRGYAVGRGLCGLRLGEHREPKRKGRGRSTATRTPDTASKHGQCIGAVPGSFSSSFSDLGPVAITVRGHEQEPRAERAIPQRPVKPPTAVGGPAGHPGPAVPFFEWERRLATFERERGRYPTAAETIELWSARDAT